MHILEASSTEAAGDELTSFDKYHLIASLGQGGMAKVFLALLAGPSDFNKLLVIKIMRHDSLVGSDDVPRMFRAEARLAARLLHPNIVHTHEVGEHDGRAFMAMEYLDGQPLSTILNRTRRGNDIPLDEFVRLLSEIARGLHYAHELKGFQGEDLLVVHRDVSPQNVIVTYEGHAKLVDFGIAKTCESEATQCGTIKGKLDYIAPEQLRGEHVDARADVFALGAILWEIISGQRFAGGRRVSDAQKIQARLAGSERVLSQLMPDAPPELSAIVTRAIAVEREDRFQDAASFADALDAYLEHAQLRPNARTLSACLCRVFARERSEMHKRIESQVARVRQLRERDDESVDRLSTPESPSARAAFNPFAPDALLDEGSVVRTAGAARASTVAPPRRRESALWWLAGGLLVAATLALVWLDARSSQGSRQFALQAHPLPVSAAKTGSTQQHPTFARSAALPAASQAPVRAQAAPSAALPPAPVALVSSVTIELSASPAQATVLLDGVLVKVPFRGRFRKDATLHHLAASANGYRPFKEFVAFDRDQTVAIALEPLGARRVAGPAPATLPARAKREQGVARLAPLLERPNPYASD